MVVETESVHDLVGTENFSATEFFDFKTTETDLPVREMARLDDPVTVFSSAYSPVETITELPQPEGAIVEPKRKLGAVMVNRKTAAAGLSVLAVQTACSWPEVVKVADDVATFLPSAGFIIFGGGLLWAAIYIQGKIQKYQDYSLLLPKKIKMKIDKEPRELGSGWFKK